MALMDASRNGIVLARANVARSRPFLSQGFSMAKPSTTEKRNVFRRLHDAGCFVIPNPWNVGSARYLQGLGFKALATFHGLGMTKHPASCRRRKTLRFSVVDGLAMEKPRKRNGRDRATFARARTMPFRDASMSAIHTR